MQHNTAMNPENGVDSLPEGMTENITMLYIGNLSPFVTEQALREIFQSVGNLKEVKIIRCVLTGPSIL